MARVFQFNNFPCKNFLTTQQHFQFTSKLSILPLNSIKRTQNSVIISQISTQQSIRSRPRSLVFASDDEEWVPDKEDEALVFASDDEKWVPDKEDEEVETESAVVAVAEEVEEEKPVEGMGMESLKKALVDSFYGTDHGLKASSETRAEIVELITQLEAKNPTPAPTQALSLLNGKWILAYTSFRGLFPLLSRGRLPLVKVEEISQTIDAEGFTVQNSVQISGPLASSSISTNAKFEIRSPRRVQIKFQEGVIGTPQLTDSIVLPENVEFLGQKIDFTPIKSLLTSAQDTASSVAKTISCRPPPLKFSLSNSKAESWLLTTYLDEDLRISRGDAGSVFVLVKEGSSLLTP